MEYIIIILLFLFLPLVIAHFSIAPLLNIRNKDLRRINKIASLRPNEVFYELGSSWGKLSSYIAKENPQAQVVGIEINYLLYLISKLNIKIRGLKNVKILYGNALHKDLRQADVIYVFGVPKTIAGKVKNKVMKEANDNLRFISYAFNLNSWPREVKKYQENNDLIPIYLWKKSL